VMEHNRKGHPSYFLGEFRRTGWWYYYPVVIAVKTPLPMLLLTIAGAVPLLRAKARTWAPLAFTVGILGFALTSQINIGVRHVLPVYMGFSLIAAAGIARWQERSRPWVNAATSALLVWFALTSALSHPDYLPYFNVLAGEHPDHIVVDSDLDWGQDTKRLAKRLREVGAGKVAFSPFIPVDLAKLGFPTVTPSYPEVPSPGWNAMSLTMLNLTRAGIEHDSPGLRIWADRIQPTERVGKSTLLWHFPERR